MPAKNYKARKAEGSVALDSTSVVDTVRFIYKNFNPHTGAPKNDHVRAVRPDELLHQKTNLEFHIAQYQDELDDINEAISDADI